jgi:hypothetical protein
MADVRTCTAAKDAFLAGQNAASASAVGIGPDQKRLRYATCVTLPVIGAQA